jgi:hypothetical protein
MRRRGKNTKTLENISIETFKGSSSNLLPDSTRRPRRYIWSQLFPLGHSDLLIVNSRLRVSVGFSPTSPKRKQKLQPKFGCRKNLSANLLSYGNTLLASGSWALGQLAGGVGYVSVNLHCLDPPGRRCRLAAIKKYRFLAIQDVGGVRISQPRARKAGFACISSKTAAAR